MKTNQTLEAHYFSTPGQVNEWHQTRETSSQTRFLLDFEIIGSEKTGLDLIDELKLGKDVVLVTSRWEEPELQKKCLNRGIFLLPKSLAGAIRIEAAPPPMMT